MVVAVLVVVASTNKSSNAVSLRNKQNMPNIQRHLPSEKSNYSWQHFLRLCRLEYQYQCDVVRFKRNPTSGLDPEMPPECPEVVLCPAQNTYGGTFRLLLLTSIPPTSTSTITTTATAAATTTVAATASPSAAHHRYRDRYRCRCCFDGD